MDHDQDRTGSEWAELWRRSPEQFGRAWIDWAGRLAGLAEPEPAPAGARPEDLTLWWKQALAAAHASSRTELERLVAQSRDFLKFAGDVQQLFAGDAGDSEEDRGRRFEALFEDLGDRFERQFTEYLSSCMAPSASAGDAASGATRNPFIEQLFKAIAPTATLSNWLRAASFAPPLGLFREHSEQGREGAHLVQRFIDAARAYLEIFGRIGRDAISSMGDRMRCDHAAGRSIESLRELHRLWVDCAEDAYGRHALTEDYARRFGQFVNSALALRQFLQGIENEALAWKNLPNRPEIDAVHRTIRALKDRIAALEQRLTERASGTAGRSPAARQADGAPERAARPRAKRAKGKPGAGTGRKRGPRSGVRSPSNPWDITSLAADAAPGSAAGHRPADDQSG